MKQGLRFFMKPGTFVNQLQWSTHHWMILLVFLVMATVEAFVGRQHDLYQVYADVLSQRVGMTWNEALSFVIAIRLFSLLFGAFLLSTCVWFVGNVFGRHTSRRVLFRRLAVVFTVVLTAYTLRHMIHQYPILGGITTGMYVWAAILGYFAIRHQFALNHLEATVLSILGFLLLSNGWYYSNRGMENVGRKYAKSLAVRQSAPQQNRHR